MPLWVSSGPKTSPNYPLNEEQLKGLLRKYDVNGDGRLSKEELMLAFKKLGLRFSCWRAGRALFIADHNRDGYVSEDEMSILVDYAKKWGFTVS